MELTAPRPDRAAPRSPGARSISPQAAALAALVFKPWAGWAARSAITGRNRSRHDPALGRFTPADVQRLLRAAWATFDRLALGLPTEPTLGSRQNVALACLTLAMFQALCDEGVERNYAVELVGDTCWKVYAQWGRIPRLASRLVTRDPLRRMGICVDMFLRYPFNRPGYEYENRPEPLGRGLDMLRCPVAEYLASHGASDLAIGSWCNLDFQLARMWGGHLERHSSLAEGVPRCDFRFRADPLVPSSAGRGCRGDLVGRRRKHRRPRHPSSRTRRSEMLELGLVGNRRAATLALRDPSRTPDRGTGLRQRSAR